MRQWSELSRIEQQVMRDVQEEACFGNPGVIEGDVSEAAAQVLASEGWLVCVGTDAEACRSEFELTVAGWERTRR